MAVANQLAVAVESSRNCDIDETLATHVASLNKEAVRESKRLVGAASSLPDIEIAPKLGCSR